MTQFIAHSDVLRTFADKKGAARAVKRDLEKHCDVHGDVLCATGTEVTRTPDGRFGVVIFLDLSETEARKLVGQELEGYVIQAELKDKTKKDRSKLGEIKIAPTAPLIHCRAGSKQQLILDALTRGCTMDDLRAICVRKNGEPWDDNSIRSALYYDMKQKGYGVRTEWDGTTPIYHVVLPAGYEAPLPPKPTKS
jgi:hypothetical protein